MMKKNTDHPLKMYIEKKGLKQVFVANYLGMDRQKLGNYLIRWSRPSYETLIKIHEFTDGEISIDLLVREYVKHALDHHKNICEDNKD